MNGAGKNNGNVMAGVWCMPSDWAHSNILAIDFPANMDKHAKVSIFPCVQRLVLMSPALSGTCFPYPPYVTYVLGK